MDYPLASTQIVTCNPKSCIGQVIEGALWQRADFGLEILIGEDCSTDGTRQIVLECERAHPELGTGRLPKHEYRHSHECVSARCRRRYFWPVLQNDRLYVHGMPACVDYFNERFGCRIPSDAGTDIRSPVARGPVILRRLNRPVEACRWCSRDSVPFAWSSSDQMPQDWDAAERLRSLCPERTDESH